MNANDRDLLPPLPLLSDGTVSIEDYISVGENFVNYFLINHARLQPHESVLDIGSGIGQKARPLSRYLTNRYDGFEIMADAVEWCQRAYASLPAFNFQPADIFSVHYNPTGKLRAGEYVFPYQSQSFDLVLLSSVFTHMLPLDVAHYFNEIARVLKTGGRCVATYFLLNHESLEGIAHQQNVVKAPYKWSEGCFVADQKSPETTVFHDESRIRELYAHNGLSIVEITFGYWSGRKDLVRSLQDVVIAIKG